MCFTTGRWFSPSWLEKRKTGAFLLHELCKIWLTAHNMEKQPGERGRLQRRHQRAYDLVPCA